LRGYPRRLGIGAMTALISLLIDVGPSVTVISCQGSRRRRCVLRGVPRSSPIAEDGSVVKTCDTNGDGRVGAVVVDVGTDQHQALQNAERKAGTYGKTLLSLASLLCFWLASLWLACTLL